MLLKTLEDQLESLRKHDQLPDDTQVGIEYDEELDAQVLVFRKLDSEGWETFLDVGLLPALEEPESPYVPDYEI